MNLLNCIKQPETETTVTNELLDTEPANLALAPDKLFAGQWKHDAIPKKPDGKVAERFLAQMEKLPCT